MPIALEEPLYGQRGSSGRPPANEVRLPLQRNPALNAAPLAPAGRANQWKGAAASSVTPARATRLKMPTDGPRFSELSRE